MYFKFLTALCTAQTEEAKDQGSHLAGKAQDHGSNLGDTASKKVWCVLCVVLCKNFVYQLVSFPCAYVSELSEFVLRSIPFYAQ